LRNGIYPLILFHTRPNGLVEAAGGGGRESSWTEFVHRKPESWERNVCCAEADILCDAVGYEKSESSTVIFGCSYVVV